MKNIVTLRTLLFSSLLFSFSFLQAQDHGFLYGKVTTIDDQVYEGPLRWGKEEVFWTDIFNSAKFENENFHYLSRDEKYELEERYHRRNSNNHRWFGEWFSYRHEENDHTHQFVCQFGELKSIKPFSRSRVDIELQNGDRIEVSGEGYNDVGTDVQVIDAEIGEIKISWGRIVSIEFMKTPASLTRKFGEPLYGTVETYYGEFTGTIQWDHDERLTTDKLDGDTRDGDLSIDFGNIASIERDGYHSSWVELKSGRKFNLDGSNDVNSSNRGIIVNTDFGRVDIPWREFKKVTFTDTSPFQLKNYDDFKSQKTLNGTVKLKGGGTQTGRLIFDLDEEKDYEVLQGNDDKIEYIIPFRNIKRIAPKNYDYSTVELKNGTQFLLGEKQDVSELNTGILVFKNGGNPVYIPWDDVVEITFD